MARLSKEDWLDEGFKLLSEFAQNKLRIAFLCERLGVTRGSFYHHFDSIDNYVEELMRAWEKQNTLDAIAAAEAGISPMERMELLNRKVVQSNQKIEAAIRSWSFYQDVVKLHLTLVDDIRLEFLVRIFRDMGMEQSLAEKQAKLDYAVLIGMQQLYPDISAREMEELWEVYRPDWSRDKA
ncbi:TetR/AcrR family transcriptional regulator [Flavilitoribacter nigricans]|uniref:TetR/AcrR family transcriptional regulator n=1 Tax=Flavilitoribacter nigricans TaxID=70997 RepID=UPI0014750FE0|nr:TetR/AcrR family transcriptional regulator [Flavilitoribacter nigricans]